MHETLIKWILVMFILFISNKNELKTVIIKHTVLDSFTSVL